MRIEQTEKTPLVYFEEYSNTFFLKGVCVPENAKEFFENIFDDISNIKFSHVIIDFYLDYFNTSSSKGILNFFEVLKNKSESVKVIWRHLEDDDEILEAGELFQEITNLEFEYISEN